MGDIKLKPSEDLAYWVGVAQTDGSFQKRTYCDSWRIDTGVGENSLPMLEKFGILSKKIFGLDCGITKRSKKSVWRHQITVTKFVESFKRLKIEFCDPKPPLWCLDKPQLFGSYLAGVIDGDGDIRIRRPKYPQCVIRITSGLPQMELRKAIKKTLKCGVTIAKKLGKPRIIESGRLIDGDWHTLEFLVSSKTIDFIKEFLIPWIQISHKRKKIESYLALKDAN